MQRLGITIAGLALSGCFSEPQGGVDTDVEAEDPVAITTSNSIDDTSTGGLSESGPPGTSGASGTTGDSDPLDDAEGSGTAGDSSSDASGDSGESDASTGARLDCDGVPGGSAVPDECGVCNGPAGPCWGCTTPSASNYDPLAELNDGTCVCEPGAGGIADQSNLSSSAGSGGQDQWQSFTVGVSGGLVRVDLGVGSPISGPSPGTLRFYEGEGTGGVELGSQAVTFEDVFNTVQEFTLEEPVPMTAGEVYTVRFSVPAVTVGWVDVAGDVYPGGRASYSASDDFVFRTTMAQCIPE